ncbi:MAG: alpha/beta fold hydrolase [Alphaproteobacteria bacterium]
MSEKIPLVLLPGLLCDAALWAHQTRHLADLADMRVADLTQDDSMAAMAARVLDSAPPKFALAGLSMGGYVAQEIMRQGRARVLKLALLDTSARNDTPEQSARRHALIELAKIGKFKGVTPRLLPLLIHKDRLDDAPLVKIVMDMAESVGRDAFFRQQNAVLGRTDSRPDLAKISCPTVIVCGRQDGLTPYELSVEIAAGIEGAKLIAIEDCGHLSTLEKPEAATAVLRYWLQG